MFCGLGHDNEEQGPKNRALWDTTGKQDVGALKWLMETNCCIYARLALNQDRGVPVKPNYDSRWISGTL